MSNRSDISRMLAACCAAIALVAFTLPLALLKPAQAQGSSDRRIIGTLAGIASQQAHGWRQDKVPLSVLETKLADGARIAVSCGKVARLGVRAARRAGYQARLAGSFTRRRLNGFDDGHVMFEVRLREGWTVFDLDDNRMAPPGTGISELVRDPRWLLIADDFPYDRADLARDPHRKYDLAAFADLDAWYARVLGVPTIWARGSIWFHDADERARGLALGERWASLRFWRKLNR